MEEFEVGRIYEYKFYRIRAIVKCVAIDSMGGGHFETILSNNPVDYIEDWYDNSRFIEYYTLIDDNEL